METFSIQNIIEGQAVGISITGMSIVFSGLILISVYIAILPKILDFLQKPSPNKKQIPPNLNQKRKRRQKHLLNPLISKPMILPVSLDWYSNWSTNEP